MQFDSLTFLVFFALVVTAYWSLRAWAWQKTLLLLASYLFYAAWNPLFLPLLIATSLLDWRLALWMDQTPSPGRRRSLMWTIIGVNLSVLGFFKYWNFFADNINGVLDTAGVSLPLQSDIALPIGISFYTFHSLSYCIDIHRRRIEAVRSLPDYLLYIAFFPQLVAGPIVRWTTIGHQFQTPRSFQGDRLGVGLLMMVVGLFEKVVLADRIFAPIANELFAADISINGAEAWIGSLSFAGQIFCDFAGYTTCALGAALVLGFEMPLNFKAPYAAAGFSDFWRRWHISLSSWLRDYLYISLGGNRRGQLITLRNLMLTMLLGGLWHGAAWTFVMWGALHGMLLILERLVFRVPGVATLLTQGLLRPGYQLFTFTAVTMVWVYFRAEDMAQANHMLWLMVSDWPSGPLVEHLNFERSAAMVTLLACLVAQWGMRGSSLQESIERSPAWVHGTVAGLMITAIALMPGEGNAFIYFQF